MVRHRDLSQRRDHLTLLGITAKTRRSFEQSIQAFFSYVCALKGRLLRNAVELDDELAGYINHSYQEGENVSMEGWIVSGLKRFLPRCKPHLQTARLFLRSWHRVYLPQRTSPLPWLGAKSMAAASCSPNWSV